MKIVFQKGIAQLVILGIMGLLAIVLPVATKLVQQNQENRSNAREVEDNPNVLPTCTGWKTGTWGTCTNGTQTRSVTKSPAPCTGTPANKPNASRNCTITCTGYTYGEWSACNSSGRRTRSVTGTTPSGCNTSPTSSPYASEPCTYVPPAPTKCTINTSSFDIGFVFCNSGYNQVWTCKSDGTWGKSDCLQSETCPSGKTACVAKPNPINGKCITSLTAAPTSSSCVSGTFKDQPDYSGHWVWDCEGVNGGTTAHCNVATPCVPGQKVCANDLGLKECNTAGTDWKLTSCSWGCDYTKNECKTAPANVCTPNTQYKCDGRNLMKCNSTGSAWALSRECGIDQTCNATTKTCDQKETKICTPGQKICANDLGLKECNSSGTDWKLTSCSWGCDYTKNECKTATGVCGSYTNLTACNNAGCWWSYDGGNSCQVCNNNPQQYKCDGRNLMKCNSSGSAWTLNRECGIDQTCNATTKTCDSKTGGSTGGNTGGSTGGNTGGSTGGNTGGGTGGDTGGGTGGDTGGGENPATLSGIKLSPNPLYLMVGKSWKVGVETIPGGLTSEYTWKSDDANIASVDMLGNVKGVTLGETYITATAKGTDISDKIKVVVDPDGSVTPEACTGYVYDEWSDCKNGTQTRNLLSKTPDGCTGNPSYAPVTTQECSDVAISYKIAFAGILPGAKCIDEYLIPETRIESDVANVPSIASGKYTDKIQTSFEETDETDSKGNRIFQVTNLVLDKDKFGSVNNFNYVKVKGPWHLKRRMCQDGQGKKMPESTVCDINLKANSGKVYDFSEYTLLAGDITADGSKRGDGVINSLDLGYIKTRLNPGSGVNCGREGDLNMDGVVNSIDLNLVKTSLTERDDE